jgi:hypothetical protein
MPCATHNTAGCGICARLASPFSAKQALYDQTRRATPVFAKGKPGLWGRRVGTLADAPAAKRSAK